MKNIFELTNLYKLTGSALFFLILFSLRDKPLLAQIQPDQTLGRESSIVNTGVVQNKIVTVINGGALKSSSLLHSFSEFNIAPNNAAYFNNPDAVSNIIVRVTGNNNSYINGTLGVLGNGNLFLLNSNGMIFGPNASLDLNGSFIGTTASSIGFANGYNFTVQGNEVPETQVLFIPTSLEFRNNISEIRVNGGGHKLITNDSGTILDQNSPIGLSAKSNQTFALFGGKVTIDGGIVTSNKGNIVISSIKSGIIQLDSSSEEPVYGVSSSYELGDINFNNKSLLIGYSANSINIFGENILINNGSVILNLQMDSNIAGNIKVYANESLKIDGFNSVRSGFLSESFYGRGKDLTIYAKNLDISNLSGIGSIGYGVANSGDISINTDKNIKISSGGLIINSSYGSGLSGNINIHSKDISIDGFTYPDQQVTVQSPPFPVGVLVVASGSGKSGNLSIHASNLTLNNGGNIGSLSLSEGNSGDISINIKDSIIVSGLNNLSLYPSAINAATFGSGNAGKLDIDARNISVLNGARIDTTTVSYGNAGNLKINATEFINIDGFASGVANPSLIDSSANILDPTLIKLFKLPPFPTGEAGSVSISAPKLIISNKGLVSIQNQGSGDAGKLEIKAGLILLDNSGILGSTAIGNGGNIDINSILLAGNSNAFIAANAQQGFGGNITINTQGLIFRPQNITATSDRGVQYGGSVKVDFLTSNFLGRTELTKNPSLKSPQVKCTNPKSVLQNITAEALNMPDDRLEAFARANGIPMTVDATGKKTPWLRVQSWIPASNGMYQTVAVIGNPSAPSAIASGCGATTATDRTE